MSLAWCECNSFLNAPVCRLLYILRPLMTRCVYYAVWKKSFPRGNEVSAQTVEEQLVDLDRFIRCIYFLLLWWLEALRCKKGENPNTGFNKPRYEVDLNEASGYERQNLGHSPDVTGGTPHHLKSISHRRLWMAVCSLIDGSENCLVFLSCNDHWCVVGSNLSSGILFGISPFIS
jgi:hypothetical protein